MSGEGFRGNAWVVQRRRDAVQGWVRAEDVLVESCVGNVLLLSRLQRGFVHCEQVICAAV